MHFLFVLVMVFWLGTIMYYSKRKYIGVFKYRLARADDTVRALTL